MTHHEVTTAVPPPGENTVNGFIAVDGAARFIEFLTAVFDGREREEARAPDFYAGDGSLIHAEVAIGNSLIMLCDKKPDWPFTPAFTQVYVADAEETLRRATALGSTVVTEVSPFYGGLDISRFLDPWHNLWWLFSPSANPEPEAEWEEDVAQAGEPSTVYTSVMDAIRDLRPPASSAG